MPRGDREVDQRLLRTVCQGLIDAGIAHQPGVAAETARQLRVSRSTVTRMIRELDPEVEVQVRGALATVASRPGTRQGFSRDGNWSWLHPPPEGYGATVDQQLRADGWRWTARRGGAYYHRGGAGLPPYVRRAVEHTHG